MVLNFQASDVRRLVDGAFGIDQAAEAVFPEAEAFDPRAGADLVGRFPADRAHENPVGVLQSPG